MRVFFQAEFGQGREGHERLFLASRQLCFGKAGIAKQRRKLVFSTSNEQKCMAKEIQSTSSMFEFRVLPEHVIVNILNYLSLPDLKSFACSSKNNYRLTRNRQHIYIYFFFLCVGLCTL